MTSRPWIAVSAALLLLAPTAYAGVGQGDIEAGVNVSLTSMEQETTTTDFFGNTTTTTTKSDYGTIGLNGGYFYTDRIEFKLALSASVSSDATFGTLNPGADFLFPTKSALVPYVGASLGLGIFDSETDFLEGHGGLKYFVNERTSIEGELSYSSPLDTDYDATTQLSVGLNVYF